MNSVLANEWSVFGLLRHGSLGRGALIFFQVALASGLSLVSGLLIKSFYEVEKVDLGFNPNHIFSFQVTPPVPRYKEPAKQSALYKASVDALAKFPGMQKVSAISSLPLTSQGLVNTLEVDGESPLFGQPMSVEEESILPGLFQTMRLPLLQGRDFTEEDREGTPSVIIVDDVFAARVWPGKNPLGKRVRMSVVRGEKTRWLEVVGVAREIKHFGPERAVRWMQVYVPQYQDPSPVLSFVVNTALPYSVAKREAEEAFHQLDQDIPVEQFQTLDAYLDTVLSPRKVSLLLLSGFAATGIVLGMIGVFGAVSNAVVQQRREIAIRIALGATRAGTMILVTKAGLLATLAGILVGSGIVISLTRLIASFLFGVSPLYPTVYVVSAVILMALALVASSAPAMRLLHFNVQEILKQ